MRALSCLALLLATTAVLADTTVRVTVINVKKAEGVLLAGAYTSAETWLGAETAARKQIPVPGHVQDGTVTFEMQLPPGRYALSILQDLNGNRTLDTGFLGIPTEATGSSNDAPARFSAPKFEAAAFQVKDQPVELRIRLN